jgi:hypothetical protein
MKIYCKVKLIAYTIAIKASSPMVSNGLVKKIEHRAFHPVLI